MNTTYADAYFGELKTAFENHADARVAAGAKAYMRNISDFYGITSPNRKQITRNFLITNGLPPASELPGVIYYAWNQPFREWQYAAMDIADRVSTRSSHNHLDLARWMIENKSWWDTVDFIAPNMVARLFKKHPETRINTINEWMLSGNKWLQRSCLIHQLKYHAETDESLLFSLCRELKTHPDFFIRKAIGWSLRQHSKLFPEAVIQFVESTTLSPLSRKEALKVIERNS
jgi:3-methyladenine DNA glycosylase AlkD